MKRLPPAVNFPRDTADFHLNLVGLESDSEITAVFLDRIGGFIFAADKRDAESGQGRELRCAEAAAERAVRFSDSGPSKLPRRWLNSAAPREER